MKKVLTGVAVAMLALSGVAVAQDAPFAMQIKARQGLMNYRAINIGTLGAMAKGDAAYDAAAAKAAADALLASASLDVSMLWPAGSDNTANPKSNALPAGWAADSDVGDKDEAFVKAAQAMSAAAGTDLASLQGAMEALGGACGACHKAYRAPLQ